jgi:ABC-type Mn2+/Zn2+ transport system permease subunit
MRSARATPAPPVVMVGYSTRLALATTFVGLVFSGLAELPDWRFAALVALLLILVSAYRTARTAGRWQDPEVRARVVVTVAG